MGAKRAGLASLCYAGDLTRAAALAEAGLAHLQAAGESWIIAEPLCILGVIRGEQGRLAEARALVEDGLAKFNEQGGRVEVFKRQNTLARLLVQQGDLAGAHTLYQTNRANLPASGYKPYIAEYLEGWGLVRAALGVPGDAARLWGAAEVLRRAGGSPMFPIYRHDYARAVATAYKQMGREAFAAALAVGRELTPAQALERRDNNPSLPPDSMPSVPVALTPPLLEELTTREREVLHLVAQGLTNPQIAERLLTLPRINAGGCFVQPARLRRALANTCVEAVCPEAFCPRCLEPVPACPAVR